ncbi:MAG: bifunctional phosphoribosylaminoimidazolecarboxamide formyltransferase/IMP cyclohydrolase [Dehalococcoidia bacterium]|nr:bifunctional phosphoribosylaminoimidazolecarboxamide formyltransferase/IMP cyclohydrolase [Dehalococcoidia bacterium]MDP6227383.1 bifunctional phosphoribosylaminoimidazolecarboxamide formyltransferase/IMP cyclohydrolase [Dehalococcoidia bacterium]MDP7084205.1 bifunctional phosphoribosylaminoimidazolecarboxamide formyltransferase/IMP cyclohydrolase [Dehalococcoidia bacterium]MDP7201857.1 bifunctional phosphoribosylaminoimidazolecarboxamide formyltransferase/IMP cyclohydrolase [Dehalococcoidia 
MKALISVYDKTGIVEFSRRLAAAGFELISTGGTHRTLSEGGGLAVRQVAEVTGSPEILEGRVKTLHPVIHAGLLARRDSPDHLAELAKHGIDPIDLVVVNLYPFVATVTKPDVTLADALENIDIGGPTMLRAAAKNFPSVAVVVDPADYSWVAEKMARHSLSMEERRDLAAKAFHHVSVYDTAVADYLTATSEADSLPDKLTLSLKKVAVLRYGENPHQQGGLYVLGDGPTGGVAGARQLHGREVSFNNLMDADAAWRTVSDFAEPTAAVVKHANPCGLASHEDQAEAYRRAYEGDSVSAFGGIVGYNRTVTAATAAAMGPVFYEVVVAPGYEPEALKILRKKRNLRLLAVERTGGAPSYDLRPISGGLLVQTLGAATEGPAEWKTVTNRAPSDAELRDLAFAWKAAKHIKSNAIVFAKDRTLVGMGAGQPNRVVSVHLARRTAGDKSRESVLASDAFFPFPDNIELAAEAGITAIVQPGGSIRDNEVIDAANQSNMAMVFTGVRNFRH